MARFWSSPWVMSRPAVLLLAGALLGACAGSSSETPVPVEPDYRRIEAQNKKEREHIVIEAGKRPGQAPAEAPTDTGAAEDEAAPATPTWGAPAAEPRQGATPGRID